MFTADTQRPQLIAPGNCAIQFLLLGRHLRRIHVEAVPTLALVTRQVGNALLLLADFKLQLAHGLR
jgi:hypothetical protein